MSKAMTTLHAPTAVTMPGPVSSMLCIASTSGCVSGLLNYPTMLAACQVNCQQEGLIADQSWQPRSQAAAPGSLDCG